MCKAICSRHGKTNLLCSLSLLHKELLNCFQNVSTLACATISTVQKKVAGICLETPRQICFTVSLRRMHFFTKLLVCWTQHLIFPKIFQPFFVLTVRYYFRKIQLVLDTIDFFKVQILETEVFYNMLGITLVNKCFN